VEEKKFCRAVECIWICECIFKSGAVILTLIQYTVYRAETGLNDVPGKEKNPHPLVKVDELFPKLRRNNTKFHNADETAIVVIILKTDVFAMLRNIFLINVHGMNQNSPSQWPRGLRHKLSSLTRTLGSWVRIPLKAWLSVCIYSMFVLCVDRGLATG
jgi:hypothetical protein